MGWEIQHYSIRLLVYRLFARLLFRSIYINKTKVVDRVDLSCKHCKHCKLHFFLPFHLFRHLKTHRKLYLFSKHCSYPNMSLLCSYPSMNRLRLTVYSILIDSSECQWRHGGDFLAIDKFGAQLCALICFVY